MDSQQGSRLHLVPKNEARKWSQVRISVLHFFLYNINTHKQKHTDIRHMHREHYSHTHKHIHTNRQIHTQTDKQKDTQTHTQL
jgi:hypothetical protein